MVSEACPTNPREASGLDLEAVHGACRCNGRSQLLNDIVALATDEASVDADDVLAYLRAHTEPLAPEYEATINLWLARIDGAEQLPADHYTDEEESHEPNDYDHDRRSEE